MIITFHPERLKPWPSNCAHNFDDVVLYPGENELTDEQWAKVQANIAFAEYTSVDAIMLRTPPKTEAKTTPAK